MTKITLINNIKTSLEIKLYLAVLLKKLNIFKILVAFINFYGFCLKEANINLDENYDYSNSCLINNRLRLSDTKKWKNDHNRTLLFGYMPWLPPVKDAFNAGSA